MNEKPRTCGNCYERDGEYCTTGKSVTLNQEACPLHMYDYKENENE